MPNMYRSAKMSAISLKPIKWDKAANAEKLEAFFVEAAKDAPQLILATEGVISKGEIVEYKWGNDRISTAYIDIPVCPSTEVARRAEREYLHSQGPEMENRYQKTIARLQ